MARPVMLNTGHKIRRRRAVLTWRSGQVAILERDYGLSVIQGKRQTTIPDLLRCAAKAAAVGLGAEDLKIES